MIKAGRQLTFGAIVLAYKQEDYISYCLRALSPMVDHIVVLFSNLPWIAYNPNARNEFTLLDRTGEILELLKLEISNMTVLQGVWDDEDSMRNTGLDELRRKGMQVCVIVDSDEVYSQECFEALKSEISQKDAPGVCYFSSYKTCYRRFDYMVESNHRLPVAVHMDSGTVFAKRRQPSGRIEYLSDQVFFWHMGYVMSDERMLEKIRTFGHAHEIIPDWYQQKWLNWTPETVDLFRKNPASRWPRTIRIAPRSLPTILHSHPFFPHDHRVENPAFDIANSFTAAEDSI